MHILDAGYANDYIMPMLHFYVRINSRTENLPRFRHGKKSPQNSGWMRASESLKKMGPIFY